MTEYLKKSFTVSLGSPEYSANWDRIFGHREGEKAGDEGSTIGEVPVKEAEDEHVGTAIKRIARERVAK